MCPSALNSKIRLKSGNAHAKAMGGDIAPNRKTTLANHEAGKSHDRKNNHEAGKRGRSGDYVVWTDSKVALLLT